MELNANIDGFKCYVPKSHFTKDESHDGEYYVCYAFAVQSLSGRVLTFHVMTDFGMLRSRVPIDKIFYDLPHEGDYIYPADYCQLWDNFGYTLSVIEYKYLSGKRCKIRLKDKSKIWGTYLFTVDWYDNEYSENAYDYKCMHIIVGDNGQLFGQPNNRITWKDMNFITKKMPKDKSIFKVDEYIDSVESHSDKWVSEDTDQFYYDIKKLREDEQRENENFVNEVLKSNSAKTKEEPESLSNQIGFFLEEPTIDKAYFQYDEDDDEDDYEDDYE